MFLSFFWGGSFDKELPGKLLHSAAVCLLEGPNHVCQLGQENILGPLGLLRLAAPLKRIQKILYDQ